MTKSLALAAALPLAAFAAACQPVAGPGALAPEAAVDACAGPVALALRARDPAFASVALAPAGASRVERREARVGRQPVALVVAGGGSAARGGEGDARVPLRYLCLVDPRGGAVFVDVETGGGAAALAECPSTGPAARRACLADRLRAAEASLARAEAAALTRVPGRAARAAIEEPLATSIGAWRVYRDAECARRAEASPRAAADSRGTCRIALTRDRAAELSG